MKMIHSYVQAAQHVQSWNALDLDQTVNTIRISMKFISEDMYIVKLTTNDNRITNKKIAIKYN